VTVMRPGVLFLVLKKDTAVAVGTPLRYSPAEESHLLIERHLALQRVVKHFAAFGSGLRLELRHLPHLAGIRMPPMVVSSNSQLDRVIANIPTYFEA